MSSAQLETNEPITVGNPRRSRRLAVVLALVIALLPGLIGGPTAALADPPATPAGDQPGREPVSLLDLDDEQFDKHVVENNAEHGDADVSTLASDALASGDPSRIGKFITKDLPNLKAQRADEKSKRDNANLDRAKTLCRDGTATVKRWCEEARKSGDPYRIESFVEWGAEIAARIDAEAGQEAGDEALHVADRVRLMVALGGPKVRERGQAALNGGDPAAIKEFFEHGYLQAANEDAADQRQAEQEDEKRLAAVQSLLELAQRSITAADARTAILTASADAAKSLSEAMHAMRQARDAAKKAEKTVADDRATGQGARSGRASELDRLFNAAKQRAAYVKDTVLPGAELARGKAQDAAGKLAELDAEHGLDWASVVIAMVDATKAAGAAADTAREAADAAVHAGLALQSTANAQVHLDNARLWRDAAEQQADKAEKLAKAAEGQAAAAKRSWERAKHARENAQTAEQNAKDWAGKAKKARDNANDQWGIAARAAGRAFTKRGVAVAAANKAVTEQKNAVGQANLAVTKSNEAFAAGATFKQKSEEAANAVIAAGNAANELNRATTDLEAAKVAERTGQAVDASGRAVKSVGEARVAVTRAEGHAAGSRQAAGVAAKAAWEARQAAATAKKAAREAHSQAAIAATAASNAHGEAVKAQQEATSAGNEAMAAIGSARDAADLANQAVATANDARISADNTKIEADAAVSEAKVAAEQSRLASEAALRARASAALIAAPAGSAIDAAGRLVKVDLDAALSVAVSVDAIAIGQELVAAVGTLASNAQQDAVKANEIALQAKAEEKSAYEAASRAAGSAAKATKAAQEAVDWANKAIAEAKTAAGAAERAAGYDRQAQGYLRGALGAASGASHEAWVADGHARIATGAAATANEAASAAEDAVKRAKEVTAAAEAVVAAIEPAARQLSVAAQEFANTLPDLREAIDAAKQMGVPTLEALAEKLKKAKEEQDEAEKNRNGAGDVAAKIFGGKLPPEVAKGLGKAAFDTAQGLWTTLKCASKQFPDACNQIVEGFKELFKNPGALIHLEEWKNNPQQALGMTVFDVITAVLPGPKGVGALGGAASKASGLLAKGTQLVSRAALRAGEIGIGLSKQVVEGVAKALDDVTKLVGGPNVDRLIPAFGTAGTARLHERLGPKQFNRAFNELDVPGLRGAMAKMSLPDFRKLLDNTPLNGLKDALAKHKAEAPNAPETPAGDKLPDYPAGEDGLPGWQGDKKPDAPAEHASTDTGHKPDGGTPADPKPKNTAPDRAKPSEDDKVNDPAYREKNYKKPDPNGVYQRKDTTQVDEYGDPVPPMRFDEETGRFVANPQGEPAVPAATVRSPDNVDVDPARKTELEAPGGLMHESMEAKKAVPALEEKAKRELDQFGVVSPETKQQLARAYERRGKAGEALGEYSADDWFHTQFSPDRFDVTARHGGAAGKGRFDRVWEVRDKTAGESRYVIVEAKGPNGTITSRKGLDGKRYEQGHPDYARSIFAEMKKTGTTAEETLASDLGSALEVGRIEYHKVQTFLDATGGYGGYSHVQFKLD